MSESAINNPIRFYAGTSGLALPVPNKQFYPEAFKTKSRLTYYASLFNSIEINSSFYKTPMAATVRRWVQEVPDDFRFTFKLSKAVTHNKPMSFDDAVLEKFMEAIDETGSKKACLLVQFPGGTHCDVESLEQMLGAIRTHDPDKSWKLCVEFRHVSWYCRSVSDLLSRYSAALVIHDMPASATPEVAMKSGFVYLRFHGLEGDYRGSYDDAIINEYVKKIKKWISTHNDVYVYFNNTAGDAVSNALKLAAMVRD